MLELAPTVISGADLPRPVPATTFRTPDGSLIDLAKYKGKVVALEFLLTTCPHCQKCSALLQRMYQQYGPQGLQVVGVATNQMAHMLVNDYRRDLGLTYPVGFTAHETAVEWLQHPVMLTMYMPQLVFIDRNGMVRSQYPGTDKFFLDEEANMRREIEALLKEPVRGQRGSGRSGKKGS